MSNKLEIKILLDRESKNNSVLIQEERKSLEYMYRKGQKRDIFRIGKDKTDLSKFYILIKCQRTTNIPSPVEENLYTLRSTYQFEIFKALVYCWTKYGKFSILRICLNGKVTISGERLFQYFTAKNPFNNKKFKNIFTQIDKVLDIKDDQNDYLTAFGYQLKALSEFVSFTYSWRCLNHIYNVVYKKNMNEISNDKKTKAIGYIKRQVENLPSSVLNKKDDTGELDKVIKRIAGKVNNVAKRNSYPDWVALIDVLQKEIKDNQNIDNIVLESKNFIEQLPKTRLIKWINQECKGNKDSFYNITGFSMYKDSKLKKKLIKAFNKASSKRRKQTLKLDCSESITNNNDYLICVYLYAYYLRNKFFHGEYRNKLLIFKKSQFIDESRKISKIIIDNNWVLLNQYYRELIGNDC